MSPSNHNTRQATIDRLEEAVTRLTQGQSSLAQNLAQIQASTNAKFDSILEHLAATTIVPFSPPSSPIAASPSSSWPYMKLNVPCFDGCDPIGLIFKASQFFNYQGIPDHELLTDASFYMEGPALC